MSIKSIYFHSMRNNRHFGFHDAFRKLVLKYGVAALKILQFWTAYLTCFNVVDATFKKIVKSALTEKVIEADRARDELFAALAGLVKAFCCHYVPAKRDAAKRLQVLFGTYGNVAKLPYTEETSAIYNLLQELKAPTGAADAAALGLFDWVEELEARNLAFDALYTSRTQEAGEKSDLILKTERAKLDEVYLNIVRQINALIVVEGEADYKAFVDNLNATIAKYAVKHPRRRGGRGGSEEEEEGEEVDDGGEEDA